MSLSNAFVIGIAALAVCAGCTTGSGSRTMGSASDPSIDGQASPGFDRTIESCRSGVYNRAVGGCVSEGGS